MGPMCVYLLIAYLQFMGKVDRSTQAILRLLKTNLVEGRGLVPSLGGDAPPLASLSSRTPGQFAPLLRSNGVVN